MCVTHNKSTVHGDTTHNWELKTEGKLRSTSAHCANCAIARRIAHEVRRSRDTDKSNSDACHVTEKKANSPFCVDSQNTPLVHEFTHAHT